jgi:hypothetical protein
MMEEAIEHGGDGRAVAREFAPVLHRGSGAQIFKSTIFRATFSAVSRNWVLFVTSNNAIPTLTLTRQLDCVQVCDRYFGPVDQR